MPISLVALLDGDFLGIGRGSEIPILRLRPVPWINPVRFVLASIFLVYGLVSYWHQWGGPAGKFETCVRDNEHAIEEAVILSSPSPDSFTAQQSLITSFFRMHICHVMNLHLSVCFVFLVLCLRLPDSVPSHEKQHEPRCILLFPTRKTAFLFGTARRSSSS